MNDKEEEKQEIVEISCGHKFHSFCIKGWIILGKKDTCPRCKEKVELARILKSTFFGSESKFYLILLSVVRFVIVWNPFFVFIAVLILRLLE